MVVGSALGLIVGVLLGLLGGGGSILAVPALVYGAHVPLAAAVPMSLLVVGVSAVTALIPRLRQGCEVAWRIAVIFGASGAAAAFAGAEVNRLLSPRVVLFGFAVVMVLAGVRMLRDDGEASGDCALADGGVNWKGCLPKAIGSGLVVGFLTGLFGVGGGFLIIPALVLLLGLPMATAVGTSLLIIVANSAAGLVAHAGDAHLDYRSPRCSPLPRSSARSPPLPSRPGYRPTGYAAGSPISCLRWPCSSRSRRSGIPV